jgi:hypothetical protein
MKKQLLLIIPLLILAAASLQAQITLNRADFPDIGYLVIRAEDNTTIIDPGSPGPNQVWDFSNLVATMLDSTYYLSPTGLPGYEKYPEANVATQHNPGSYLNGGYNVNYWNMTSQRLQGVGDESLVNLFGTFYFAFHIDYLPPATQLNFPFTFGGTNVQEFAIEWITAVRNEGITTDSSKTVSHVHMDCLADAWGTMILPDGSFPVLRVRETWSSVDSSFVWESGAWAYQEDTISNWTQYRWYANDIGEVGYWNPDGSRGPGFTFFKSETLVGMDEPSREETFTLFPNPTYSQVQIQSDREYDRVSLMDCTGKVLMMADYATSLDLTGLPAGLYFIRVEKGNKVSVAKLFKK